MSAIEAARRIRLCEVDELADGEAMQVTPDDHAALAVFRVGSDFYCTQDKCTHAGASLGAEGSLDGHVVQCSWHEGRFDVRTGQVCAPPCQIALRTYPVVIEAGTVYAEVNEQ
jgi:p-cumate 2,3-dioxygenase ferredoxin component